MKGNKVLMGWRNPPFLAAQAKAVVKPLQEGAGCAQASAGLAEKRGGNPGMAEAADMNNVR